MIPVIDYRRHPAYGAMFPKPTAGDRVRALRAITPCLVRASADRIVRSRRPGTSSLGEDGVTTMRCNPEWLTECRGQLEAAFGPLPTLAKPGEPMVNEHLTPRSHPGLIELVRQELDQLGVLASAAAYLERQVSVQTVVLKVTDAASTFRRDIFADLALPDPTARYMHVDSSAPRSVVKLLIYLSDVGDAEGPFTYVRGSHLYRDGLVRSIARRAVHKAKTFQECDPESRRRFLALPRFLQHKAEFGNDMTDETAVARLTEREERFCGPAGLLVLFDNSGIHRGGLVRDGHRSAIQVTLR